VKSKGATYAYAYDKGLKLFGQLGFGGFPSAVLVDAAGMVVWSGSSGNLQKGTIEEHLKGALPKPMWEWPDETKDLRKAILKGDLAKSVSISTDLASKGEEFESVANAVKAMVAGKAAAVEGAHAKGDFLAAETLGKSLLRSLKGLPEAERVDAVLDAMKADRNTRGVIKAQKALAKIKDERPKLNRAKKVDEAIGQVERIIRSVPGTYAEATGKELIAELEKAKETLR
jgi:hypothetical protein